MLQQPRPHIQSRLDFQFLRGFAAPSLEGLAIIADIEIDCNKNVYTFFKHRISCCQPFVETALTSMLSTFREEEQLDANMKQRQTVLSECSNAGKSRSGVIFAIVSNQNEGQTSGDTMETDLQHSSAGRILPASKKGCLTSVKQPQGWAKNSTAASTVEQRLEFVFDQVDVSWSEASVNKRDKAFFIYDYRAWSERKTVFFRN